MLWETIRALAAQAGQAVLDRLGEGLLDADQDELVAGVVGEIERVLLAGVPA
ncbi:MAG TPA: hypothetical protein VD866_20150 [Urbifossiella sp.]|nr:hypothetical protein [Urbifossiella sp.]